MSHERMEKVQEALILLQGVIAEMAAEIAQLKLEKEQLEIKYQTRFDAQLRVASLT
jgi:hypothetical protein